jgi:hypothetical protein
VTVCCVEESRHVPFVTSCRCLNASCWHCGRLFLDGTVAIARAVVTGHAQYRKFRTVPACHQMPHLCAVNVLGIFPVPVSAETFILTVFLLRHVFQQNADAVPMFSISFPNFISSDLSPVKFCSLGLPLASLNKHPETTCNHHTVNNSASTDVLPLKYATGYLKV